MAIGPGVVMMGGMRWLLALAATIGCTKEPLDEHTPDGGLDAASVCVPDTTGFGGACEIRYNPNQLWTDCTTPSCEVGVCGTNYVSGPMRCRKRCKMGIPLCAPGETATPTQAGCVCYPPIPRW